VFLFCLLVTCSDGGDETEDREEGKGVVEGKGDMGGSKCVGRSLGE
jgi:hypothetical protein